VPPLERDSRGVLVSNTSPASKFVVLVPDDNVDLTPTNIRGVWVGIGGDLAIVGLNDVTPITLQGIPTGALLPIMVKKILATGTSAAGLVGFT